MSIGASTAIGAPLGAAYGASSGQLALFVALGAAVGASLYIVVHFINLRRRKRADNDRQS
jgi:hypothetical protein